jgi:hypothetical protein
MVLLDWPPPIISASAENRGNSCQRKHKEEERRERYIGGVTALYDRGRDIAPVAMTATLVVVRAQQPEQMRRIGMLTNNRPATLI